MSASSTPTIRGKQVTIKSTKDPDVVFTRPLVDILRYPDSILARLVSQLANGQADDESSGTAAQPSRRLQTNQDRSKRRLVDAEIDSADLGAQYAALPNNVDLELDFSPQAMAIALHVHSTGSICGADLPEDITLELLQREVLGKYGLPDLYRLPCRPSEAADNTLHLLWRLWREAAAERAARDLIRLMSPYSINSEDGTLYLLVPAHHIRKAKPASAAAPAAGAAAHAGAAAAAANSADGDAGEEELLPTLLHVYRYPEGLRPTEVSHTTSLGTISVIHRLDRSELIDVDGKPLPPSVNLSSIPPLPAASIDAIVRQFGKIQSGKAPTAAITTGTAAAGAGASGAAGGAAAGMQQRDADGGLFRLSYIKTLVTMDKAVLRLSLLQLTENV